MEEETTELAVALVVPEVKSNLRSGKRSRFRTTSE